MHGERAKWGAWSIALASLCGVGSAAPAAHAGAVMDVQASIVGDTANSTSAACVRAWVMRAFEALDNGELQSKRVHVFPEHERVKAMFAQPHFHGVRTAASTRRQLVLSVDSSEHTVLIFEERAQAAGYALYDWPERDAVRHDLDAAGVCPIRP